MVRQRKRPEELRSHRWYGAVLMGGCDFDFLHAGAPTPDPEIH